MASTVTYLIPVVAVLFGMIALGESLSLRVLAGMLVVLVGVGLVRRTRRPVAVAMPQASVDICSPGRSAGQCSTSAARHGDISGNEGS